MFRSVLHPATRLVVWLVLLIAVQLLSGRFLALVCLLAPVLGVRVMRRGGRLMWRARWLLFSLLAVFAWGTAGEALWNSGWAPTYEGVMEASKHLGRMLLVLMLVATFLEYMPLADLISATHALLLPFRRFGLDTTRGVVRLMLVLRYVETLPRPRDWKVLLDAPDSSTSEIVEIEQRAAGWGDVCVMAGLVGGLLFLCFS
jgi:energy-coupling factor transporter transmembrane protein EcfT